MQPLADFPQNALRKIRFVLTDIDDTLTEKGRLPAASYLALERLQQFGIKVIPITGRPAGWCDHIARMWPVDGVVGENGAFYFVYDSGVRTLLFTAGNFAVGVKNHDTGPGDVRHRNQECAGYHRRQYHSC